MLTFWFPKYTYEIIFLYTLVFMSRFIYKLSDSFVCVLNSELRKDSRELNYFSSWLSKLFEMGCLVCLKMRTEELNYSSPFVLQNIRSGRSNRLEYVQRNLDVLHGPMCLRIASPASSCTRMTSARDHVSCRSPACPSLVFYTT